MKKVILLLALFVNISFLAFADEKQEAVTMVSYEQDKYDSRGTLSVKNNTDEDINNIKFQITYFDMKGNPIDRKTFSKEVTIYPGFVKMLFVPAYQTERDYHYFESKGGHDSPAFKIQFKLISYNNKKVEKENPAEKVGDGVVLDTDEDGENVETQRLPLVPGLFAVGLGTLMPFLFLGAYIGIYVIVAEMARKRNRNVVGWLILSLFLSPILVMLILLIAGDSGRRMY